MPDTHVGVEDNPGPGEGRIREPNNQGAQPGRTGGHRAVTSTYRGVCWHRKSRRWQSAINISGKHIYLGSFDTEEEAARTFDKVALRVRGSRAKLNFPSQDYLDPDGALTPEPHLERLVAEARKALLEKQRCQERDAYEQREQYATETKRRRLQAGADSAAVRLINGSDVYTGPRGMMPPGIEMGLSGLGSGWGSTDLSGIAVLHPHLPGVDMAAALAGSSASAGGGPAGPGGGMWVLQQQQREEDVRQARLRCLQRQQAGWRDSGDGGGSGSMYGDDVGAPGGPMDGFHHGHEAPAGHGQQAYCGRPEVPQAGSLRRHHLIPLQSKTDAVTVLGTTGPSSRASGAGPGLLSAPGLMHVQTLAQLPPRRGPPGDPGEPSEWASGRITVGGAGLQLTQGAFVYQRDGVLPAGAGLYVRGESSGGLAFTQSGRCEGNNNNGSGGGGDVYGEGGSSIPLALIGRFLTGVGRELPLGCSVKLLVPCSDPDLLGYTYTKELPGQGQADREGEGGGGEGARAMDPTTGKRTLPSQPQRGSADGEGGSGGGAGIYFRGMYRDLGLYTTTVDAMQACKACMAVLLDCRHMLAAEGGVAAEARGLPPPPLLSHTQAPLTAPFRQPDVETLAAVAEAVQSARGSSAWPLNRNQPPAGAPGIKVLHDTPVSGLQPLLRMPPQGPPLHSSKQQPSSTAPHNVQDAAPAATWFHPPPATPPTTTTTTTTQAPRLYRAHHMDSGTAAGDPESLEPAWRAALAAGVNEVTALRGKESGPTQNNGSRFKVEQPLVCRTDQVGGPQSAGGAHIRPRPEPSQAVSTARPSSGVVLESTPEMLHVLLQLLGAAARARAKPQQDQPWQEQQRQTGDHAEEGRDEGVATVGGCRSPSPALLWRGVPMRPGVPLHVGSCVGAAVESRQQGGVVYLDVPVAARLREQQTDAATDTGRGNKQDGWRVEHDLPRSLGTVMQLQGYEAGGKVGCVGGAGGVGGAVGDGGDKRSRQIASKGSSDSTTETLGDRCRREC